MVTLKDFFQRHRQMSEINTKSFFFFNFLSEDFIVFTFIVLSDFFPPCSRQKQELQASCGLENTTILEGKRTKSGPFNLGLLNVS